MKASDAVPDAAAKTRSGGPSTFRLVIRAEIIPEQVAPTPIRRHSNQRLLMLVLSAVAILALSWAGFRAFRTAPTSAPVASEGERDLQSRSPVPTPGSPTTVTSTADVPSAAARAIAPGSDRTKAEQSPAPDEKDAPTSPIHTVIPEVPRSALQTIRGTVRVAIQATVDTQGTVVAVETVDSGPSRYFERLSLEASRQWRFAPADLQGQRIVLLRFAFSRTGASARTGD